MMKAFTAEEELHRLPVRGRFDVVVAGAGLGGISAALAAARAGARTLLVERNGFPGGVATAGMCCSIFNCYFTAQGKPGVTGIPVEIADALARATGYGRKWRRHKGHVIYDIELAKLAFERLLVEAEVQVLYNAWTASALRDGSVVRGVAVESKAGREALLADVVVDATGDADVAATAGAPVRTEERALHSLCFRLGNVDVAAFVDFFRRHPDQYPAYMDVHWDPNEALAQFDDCGTFLFPHGGGMQMAAFQKAQADGNLPATIGCMDSTDACQMHALRQTGMVHVVTGFARFNGLDPDKITRSILDGRRMAHTVAAVYRRYIPGFRNAFVAGTAANLGVRTSRWLDGEFTFTPEMMAAGNRQPDAVGRAVGWDHPVLHRGPNAWGCQKCRSDSFDLPYRCLLPRNVDGLLMGAGRSVGAAAPHLLRVMVHTMVVGQAAGAAAAVAARLGCFPRETPLEAIQMELEKQNVRIR
ncbi:MAG: FAD-dependent oxidoreductase [Kiritimatiellaeota bacterium]|nr:FAD-dependent oxidoreductase [Kiritimatiellota bacterium]